MIKRIKEYLEYRKSKKIAKRELIKIAASTLPSIRRTSNNATDIVKFFIKLADETKNIHGERLVELVLNEVSTILQTDNSHIVEILTYIANLTPEDIQKILVHSVVETIPTKKEVE